jgi:hypothetical protein
MRFIRQRPEPPSSLILDITHPPCGWSSRDSAVPVDERLCMLPGARVEERVLCDAHRGDLLKARARRARVLAA